MMKKTLLLISVLTLFIIAGCGGNQNEAKKTDSDTANNEATTENTKENEEIATNNKDVYFKDNEAKLNDLKIKITETKVIQPGETGNEYGEKPVFAIWYETTNLSDKDIDPTTAWMAVFEAVQDNNPNAVNTLEVGGLPDNQFLDSQLETIKKDGTVPNAVAYELDDLETPVTLIATQGIGGDKLGEQNFDIATEASGASGDRTVSGFNKKTNNKITWCGVDFSYPSYFDTLDQGSTETMKSYYPEEKDYYASILFQSKDFSGTQEDFNSSIPSIVKSTLEAGKIANSDIQKSEKTTIAGLPGWTITYTSPDTEGDGVTSTTSYSFAYNIDTGKVVMISCTYDSNDKSKYDYLGDYKKVLKTSRLLAEPLDLNAINSTNSAESDAQFVGKHYRVTGVIDQAMEPSDADGLNAMVIIQPDVMAKGMGSTLPLEINIWLTADEFEKIGGISSAGKKIDLSVKLISISRNAISKDPAVKGYPIQLEFGDYD
jgi:hypothetical protein